jgi:hypothetical protein
MRTCDDCKKDSETKPGAIFGTRPVRYASLFANFALVILHDNTPSPTPTTKRKLQNQTKLWALDASTGSAMLASDANQSIANHRHTAANTMKKNAVILMGSI